MKSPAEVEFFQRYALRLRARRKRCGLSQEELAAYLGRHRNILNRWETGQAIPNLYWSKRLNRALEEREMSLGIPSSTKSGAEEQVLSCA